MHLVGYLYYCVASDTNILGNGKLKNKSSFFFRTFQVGVVRYEFSIFIKKETQRM